MPMYYFHLQDDEYGAARVHAAGVARELTSNSAGFLKQDWSEWTMSVHDEIGTEVSRSACRILEIAIRGTRRRPTCR
jgi:hypothetical protein